MRKKGGGWSFLASYPGPLSFLAMYPDPLFQEKKRKKKTGSFVKKYLLCKVLYHNVIA